MSKPGSSLQALANLHKELAEAQLVFGANGNASYYDRASGLVWIKASGVACARTSPRTLVGVLINGELVNPGGLIPSTDLPLHLQVYRRVAEASYVVHTHSVFATAYSISGKNLPTYVSGTAEIFGRGVPCVPHFAERKKLSIALNKALQPGTRACLLQRHGTLSWAPTAETALAVAQCLEWSAQIALLADPCREQLPMVAKEVRQYGVWYEENYGQTPRKRTRD